MQQYTVSRDDRYHEAWPSICTAADGNLVCCYSEADRHGGGALPSAIVRISGDDGATWGEPIVVETFMDRPDDGYFMCRSIIRLLDDSLLLAVDWNKTESLAGESERWYAHRGLPIDWSFDSISGPNAQTWLYRSIDGGRTWSGPEKTGCLCVSSSVMQIGDGSIFLSGSPYRCAGLTVDQVLYRSADNGHTWSDAIPVIAGPHIAAEGHIVEVPTGELVTYIRSDDNPACVGVKAISTDGGLSWDGPFACGYWPISGRINAGLLSSGEILVTYRVGGFHPQNWFGYFLETPETALARIPNTTAARMNPPALTWGMIDNDTSRFADHGYGDWVELPGGDIYVVNYVVDDAPEDRPQIRGYRISRDELFERLPARKFTIDFAGPDYRRGKLASQQSWVRQIPELWGTTQWLEEPGLGYLGNYVIIDPESGDGGPAITGTRNLGGKEEVVRRDIGPYDLLREEVDFTIVHRGRQRVAIVRLVDEHSRIIIELRSDSVFEQIWAMDNRGHFYHSGMDAGEAWLETRIRVSEKRVEVRTGAGGGEIAGEPWAVVIPDESYDSHAALAAVVIALGDEGGFFIDRMSVEVSA